MIYHITTQQRWNEQTSMDSYYPEMFVVERFIHCCDENQVDGVLSRYFNEKKDLLKLCIDVRKLKFPLKYESGTNYEMFPHLYGELNKDAIVKIVAIL